MKDYESIIFKSSRTLLCHPAFSHAHESSNSNGDDVVNLMRSGCDITITSNINIIHQVIIIVAIIIVIMMVTMSIGRDKLAESSLVIHLSA